MFYLGKSRNFKVDVLSRKIQKLQGRCFILGNREITRSMFYLGKSRNYKVNVLSMAKMINTILYILKANPRHKTYVLHVFQVFNYSFVNWTVQHKILFVVHCTANSLTGLYTVQFISVLHCTLCSSLLYFNVHCTVQYCTAFYTVSYNTALFTLLYCTVHFTVLYCTLYCTVLYTLLYCTIQLYCVDLHTCSSHI